MNNKEKNYRIAHEALIVLAAITLLSFMCRLWPIILLALVGTIIAAIRLLFLKARTDEPIVSPTPEEVSKIPELKDVYDLAFSLIPEQITKEVLSRYASAKWVWETQNAKKKIENGEDVYILLNSSGGYRRAKVCMTALRVTGLEYQTQPEAEPVKETEQEEADEIGESDSEEEQPQVNYELIAYEWVDAHIMELNARCNETIGEKKECLHLTPEELPAKESWENVCAELIRADLCDVECQDDGIRIYFKRKTQKGNETHEHMDEQFI